MASAFVVYKMPPKNKKPATSCFSLVSGLLKSDLWLS